MNLPSLHRLAATAALPVLLALAVAAPPVPAHAADDMDPKKAIKKYRKAVEKAPDDADNWYNLGLACIMLERWDEAVEATGRAVELNPESPNARFRAGEALAGAGRSEEAVEQFREAARLDPAMVPAHVQLARAERDAGRHDAAIAALKDALRGKPEDPTGIYALMGEIHLEAGDSEQAVRWLERTLEAKPDDPAATFNLAVTLRQAGRTDPALMKKSADVFKKAADLDRADPAAQFYAGETLVWVGRNEEARPYLERYIELDPDGARLGAEASDAAREYLALIGG